LESDVGVGLEVGSALEEVLLLAGRILRSDLLAEKALHGNAFLVIYACGERAEVSLQDAQRDG
jgi:hypothetical protein